MRFRDSTGIRGTPKKPYLDLHKHCTVEIIEDKNIRFNFAKPIKITNRNAIRLAHWILDKCS